MTLVLLYGSSVLAAFAVSFFKAFNSKNIVGGHYLPAWITSWGITTCEAMTVLFIVKGGWTVLISAGVGGSFGVVAAMWFHDRVFKRGR